MAVKPTIAYTWATDANYTSGPYPGQPNKQPGLNIPEGFIPGTVAQSEVVNYMFGATGEWTGWLAAGSTVNTIDAHLVETNNQGVIAVVGGEFGGAVSNQTPIFAQQNLGSISTADIRHDGGGGALPAYALGVTKTGGGIGDDAVSITNNGFSWGVDLFSADTSEGGARVVTDSVPALVAEVATGNAVAVSGKVTTGTGAAGMFEGNSANGAPAVSASQGGAGLTRAPLYVAPGTTDPTLKQAGDIWTVTEAVGAGEARLRWSPDGSTQSVWTTAAGMFHTIAEDTPGAAVPNAANYGGGVLVATATIPANAPDGQYRVTFDGEFNTVDACLIIAEIVINGAGTPIRDATTEANTAYSGNTISITTNATVTKAGASDVVVEVYARTQGGPAVGPTCARTSEFILGVF